jgi:HlyD family secretion protein
MKNRTNKYVKYTLVAVTVALLVFTAVRFLFGSSTPMVTLETTALKKANVTKTVTATGTVQPVNQVTVGTQVSGLVSKIYVDYNSNVTKGQLLAELDKTILSESVKNAQELYNAALNDQNYYRQNYNRQSSMYNAQVISRADFEQAGYQLKNAQAVLGQRKATLLQAQTNLKYANIYAPIDGVVLTRSVEEGQTVAASMTAPTLFTIARDITKMQVEANVDEADIGNIMAGQRVTFTVDAFPGEKFTGKVNQVRLGAVTASTVVTYTVIVDANNPEEKLRPGLTATITIFTTELHDVYTLPAKALSFVPKETLLTVYYQQQGSGKNIPEIKPAKDGLRYIWIKNKNGVLEQREIVTGISDGINIEILDGISIVDTVVTAIVGGTETSVQTNVPQTSPFMPANANGNNNKASSH